ncbi:hypothetical protein [Lacisediminimonas profundi]|uniref:hypothetical protein n=1 Tax=Lacisediminimonas profundi TaxID=2603856 RepID=UPI00124B996F|nr:hypothetical protein [Lacisediminimonas profundi]
MQKEVPGTFNRWVLGDYIIYSADQDSARGIYETALGREDKRVLFGTVRLIDGEKGSWVMIKGRKADCGS